MQPPPDALAEFRVVTNNMSAEYGRSRRRDDQRRLQERQQPVPRRGLGVLPRHVDEREGFFKPAGRQARAEAQSVRLLFGGPILRNRAFFFTDYEGFRQDREVVTLSTIATKRSDREF